MAAGLWVLLCVGVVSLTKQGHGQLHQINLTGGNIQCNMSSTYSDKSFGTSAGCQAAINGNTGTTWIPINQTNPPNCIYTDNGDVTPSWIVNLGQGHNIHKIQIYFHEGYLHYVINATISVDGVNIFTFPSSGSSISNPHTIVSQHLPVRGRIIAMRRTAQYVTLCEFQAYECAMNKHGPNCGKSCSQHCVSQQGQTSCDSITGNCSQGCQTGWWGAQCNTQCPVQCDGPCDREMGHCSTCMGNFVPPTCTECKSGWYGIECDNQCSDNCLPDNNGHIICRQHDGRCAEGCKDGWWDAQCNHRCPLHCNEPCDRNTGRCQNCSNHFAPPNCTICLAGWHGALCERECSVNCEPNNDVVTCEQDDGMCISDCKPGFHGATCAYPCGNGCVNNNCSRQDGACTCLTGWSPPNCTACNTTLWSPNCSLSCGQCAGDGSCDMDTGHCLSGCMEGYEEADCEKLIVPDSTDNPGAIVGGMVAAVLVVVAVVVAIFFVRRRGLPMRLRRRKDSEGNLHNERADNSSPNQFSNVAVGGHKASKLNSTTERPSGHDDKLKTETNKPANKDQTKTSADKPQAHIKPMKNSDRGTEKQSDRCHLYGNISSLPSSTAGGSSKDRPATASSPNPTHPPVASNAEPVVVVSLKSAPEKPIPARSKPTTSPKPSPASVAGNTYENFPLPEDMNGWASESAKTSQNAPKSPRLMQERKSQLEDDMADADDVYNSEDVYGSYKSLSSAQFDPFQRYLIRCLASGELGVQFASLPKGMKHPHKVGMSSENKPQNRFKAICAYDDNRVILHRPGGDNSSDYINASYIKGCQREKQYIATQGPRAHTVDDLWWMVWQEGVTQILMLTNLKEDGKEKCEEYWPASGKSNTCGHVTVSGLEEQKRADFVIRSFLLKAKGSVGDRHVTQYHYMAWPDHGVPQAASLVDFWRYVKTRAIPAAPLLVHCSAGVGRSGTLIALDIASELESGGRDVGVNELVIRLREERCLMVQSEAQYKFLYEVILEAHTSRATRIHTDQMGAMFSDAIQVNTSNARIDKEFQMLKQMGQFSPKPKHTMANMPENLDKNRNMDALPDDEHVTYLTVYVRGRNQYINAVYMPSFKHRQGFVLTQMPIPNNTLVDFWRLVEGSGASKVISLSSGHEEETVKNFCHYWPRAKGEVLTTGPYTITMNSSSRLANELNVYSLTFKSKTDDSPRDVEVLHFIDWAGEVPGDTSSLLHLVDNVKATQSNDVTTPIIVQCIDGAARSGLFCAVFDVINRMTSDDEIDVYLTARHVQRIRPQAVFTQTEYRFLYKAAQDYIHQMEIYANSGVK